MLSNCRSTFSPPIEALQNMVFENFNICTLKCGNKNKSLGGKSIRRFRRSKRRWFELSWCTMIRLLLFVTRISPKTSVTQNAPSYVSQPFLTEETGDNLLRSASFLINFRWIWLVFKDSHGRLQFCFGHISVDPRFATCDAIVFFQNFFAPIRMTLL